MNEVVGQAAEAVLFIRPDLLQKADPILRMIGVIDAEPFADDVDDAVYSSLRDRRLSMKCYYCKDRMIRGTAPFSADRHGYHIAWEAVPAWICTQCGEPLFEENEVSHIQGALQQIDRETLELTRQAAY